MRITIQKASAEYDAQVHNCARRNIKEMTKETDSRGRDAQLRKEQCEGAGKGKKN